jgi:hypothetical protein
MDIRNKVTSAARRGGLEIVNSAGLSRPDYQRIEFDSAREAASERKTTPSDVGVFGRLTVASGLAATAAGVGLELLPESTDNMAHMVVGGSLGATAIGGLILAYDKLR